MADSGAERGRVAPRLRLCHGCEQFVRPGEPACRFCGGDLDSLEAAYESRRAEIRAAMAALREAMAERQG